MQNKSTVTLPNGYTMSDLGFITQVLAHVESPAKSMICEDYDTQYMIYGENYRDLHPCLFKIKMDLADRLVSSAFGYSFAELQPSYELTEDGEKYENIDWGYHEPTVGEGHKYDCSLQVVKDVHQEIKYIRLLMSQDCEDVMEYIENARRCMKIKEFDYSGVQQWRAIYWLKHLSMFDYRGCVNEYSHQDWASSKYKEILDEVVKHSIPFYASPLFGTKKKKKDVWHITKYQATRVTRTRRAGQLFEIPPHYSGGYKKREFWTSLGLFGKKNQPTFTFKVVDLPNPDTKLEKGTLTKYQKQVLDRQERARFAK